MNKIKVFIKGVILGGLVGAAIGFFNAPKEGKEMQKDAKNSIKKLIKKTKEVEKDLKPKAKKIKKALKKIKRKK